MPEISKIELLDGTQYDIKDAKARMVILKYGISTWNDYITAYNNNCIVYCRASSNSNPASGTQTRLAFMAYVDNEITPTSVEFQYYRSLNKHTDSQQGDQVYVYKLTIANTWTVTTRNAFSKVIAGDNITSSFVESGTNSSITLNADYDSTVTSGSTKLITSGAVASAIANLNAGAVSYDNTTSGLTADDVQGAIDEIYISKPASSGGTDLSLVTTGEKYTWNNKASTNTTYTFANGTNGFTVTPSGGSAQTVTVTPSITNNITGSGTKEYIAKFTSANTVGNGPAFGSTTNQCLCNDGAWRNFTNNAGTVTQVKVGTTAYNPSSGVVSLPAYPSVGNGTITIQLNGTSKGSFTTNQSGAGTININGVQTTLSTSDVTSSLSISGNFQSVTKKLFKYGNVVELFMTANVKTAIADNGVLFTVPTGYNPKVNDVGFTFFTGTDQYIPTGFKFGYFTWGGRDFHTLGALGVGTQVTVHITYLI